MSAIVPSPEQLKSQSDDSQQTSRAPLRKWYSQKQLAVEKKNTISSLKKSGSEPTRSSRIISNPDEIILLDDCALAWEGLLGGFTKPHQIAPMILFEIGVSRTKIDLKEGILSQKLINFLPKADIAQKNKLIEALNLVHLKLSKLENKPKTNIFKELIKKIHRSSSDLAVVEPGLSKALLLFYTELVLAVKASSDNICFLYDYIRNQFLSTAKGGPNHHIHITNIMLFEIEDLNNIFNIVKKLIEIECDVFAKQTEFHENNLLSSFIIEKVIKKNVNSLKDSVLLSFYTELVSVVMNDHNRVCFLHNYIKSSFLRTEIEANHNTHIANIMILKIEDCNDLFNIIKKLTEIECSESSENTVFRTNNLLSFLISQYVIHAHKDFLDLSVSWVEKYFASHPVNSLCILERFWREHFIQRQDEDIETKIKAKCDENRPNFIIFVKNFLNFLKELSIPAEIINLAKIRKTICEQNNFNVREAIGRLLINQLVIPYIWESFRKKDDKAFSNQPILDSGAILSKLACGVTFSELGNLSNFSWIEQSKWEEWLIAMNEIMLPVL